jgi:GNAT superfamily N-acetyltransferase
MPTPTPAAASSSIAPRLLLRPAQLRDIEAIVELIRELADFEKLTHLLQVTPEKLRPHLFGEKPAAECIVAELAAIGDAPGQRGTVVGFALFFTNFSTFLAQPGLYLEDLYVKTTQRGQGIGEALLTRLARLAVERNYGRFEWSVLDWNANAIRFYERMGATVMPDWRICRITGDALKAFAPPGALGALNNNDAAPKLRT